MKVETSTRENQTRKKAKSGKTGSGGAEGWDISEAQMRAIEALQTSTSFKIAAERAGVTDRTLRNWRDKDHNFKRALREYQDENTTQQTRNLVAIAPALQAMLFKVALNEHEPSPTRVRAAQVLLGQMNLMVDKNDMAERLAELEAARDEGKNRW